MTRPRLRSRASARRNRPYSPGKANTYREMLARQRSKKDPAIKEPAKRKGPALGRPFPHTMLYSTLPLSNDWRRGFALADILSATSDAQESQHRGCC